ncbi:hypothetical protein [Haloprofundus salinisoli]|uniref:hypothetical protein n=1 Tax=Haloprofundus salinisoli TaxID=2876193 RepID=UPI001CCDEEB9|nr:hypothetical protein [Haloprofundus salinisoli]
MTRYSNAPRRRPARQAVVDNGVALAARLTPCRVTYAWEAGNPENEPDYDELLAAVEA